MASSAIFAAFTIMGLVAMATSVEIFNGQCPQPNGDFGNPTSQRCKTYVRCQGGVPSNMVCPQGQRFDFVLRQCLARRLVDCRGQKAAVLSLPNALNPPVNPGATVEPIANTRGNNAFAGLGQSSPQVAAAQGATGQVQPLPLSGNAAVSVRRVGRRGRQVAPDEVPATQDQFQGQNSVRVQGQGQGANRVRGQGQSANRGQGQGARVNAGQGRPALPPVNRGVVTDVPDLFLTFFPTFFPVTATVGRPNAQRPQDLPVSVPITPLGGPIAVQDRVQGQGQDEASNETAGIALQGRSTFP